MEMLHFVHVASLQIVIMDQHDDPENTHSESFY